jgi:hypothetical protein
LARCWRSHHLIAQKVSRKRPITLIGALTAQAVPTDSCKCARVADGASKHLGQRVGRRKPHPVSVARSARASMVECETGWLFDLSNADYRVPHSTHAEGELRSTHTISRGLSMSQGIHSASLSVLTRHGKRGSEFIA